MVAGILNARPDSDEYEKLVLLMNAPRVAIDNSAFPKTTLVTVDSARGHRYLMEAVQVLSDLNLSIDKAYFSADGGWFMDVFHVTDQSGCKLTDERVISFIEETLDSRKPNKQDGQANLTAIELSGCDRPGLLSEIFAVLADSRCAVSDAREWTHNGRMAALIFISDEDSRRASSIQSRLRSVLHGRVAIASMPAIKSEHRLHQMLHADRDFEASAPLVVSIQSLPERGYSVATVQCTNRPKLLFDIVCSLTHLDYHVFHGNVRTEGSNQAHLEFYIKHSDGRPISSEAERLRVMQCVQAAIDRRGQGLRMEIIGDRSETPRILSDTTRAIRENGLLVRSAEVSTKGESVTSVFCVADAAGGVPSSEIVESVRRSMGRGCCLTVREPEVRICEEGAGKAVSGAGTIWPGLASLGRMVLGNLCNLVGIILLEPGRLKHS